MEQILPKGTCSSSVPLQSDLPQETKVEFFVPQAVWAAVDNLLAHDDCRILFVVLKSNATVPLSILIYP